ncbi:uncharacterized protein LOC128034782 [Gossypium raimondii]|uniref:uncharacterized protein LOC128034782 n=1 Tax=Gossypium raimondii TaxID=29730 RepID=UPI002279F672|nr:uncharacterized protein LOC128034782 [Gossypium raimondii]
MSLLVQVVRCHTPLCSTELGEKKIMGPDLVSEAEDKVRLIRDYLKATSDRQKSYVDLKRKDIEFFVGDWVFLKVSPWRKVLRFGHKGKRYQSEPLHIVPVEKIEVSMDLTSEEESIQILDREVKVLRKKTISLVKVLWQNYGTEEATWEPEDSI